MKKIAVLMVCLQAASWGMHSFAQESTLNHLKIAFQHLIYTQAREHIERIENRHGFGCKILQCVNIAELAKYEDEAIALFRNIDEIERAKEGDALSKKKRIVNGFMDVAVLNVSLANNEPFCALIEKEKLEKEARDCGLKKGWRIETPITSGIFCNTVRDSISWFMYGHPMYDLYKPKHK